MNAQPSAADRSPSDLEQGIGLALLDTSARLMFANDGFVAMNRLPIQEHLGRTVADLWPHVWPLVAERFAEVVAGEGADFDMSLPDPDDGGRLRAFHVYWFPVRVQDTVIGVSATIIDVKTLRASERQAQEIAARQQSLRRIANRALTDSPIDEVFDEALAALERHLNVPLTRSMRIEVGSRFLGHLTGRGWDEEFLALWRIGPRTGSFADLAITNNRPTQFEDLTQAQPFRKSELFAYHGVMSGIGQAVRVGGRPWGMIAAYDRRPRVFKEDEVAFIEELAAILGLILQERDARAFREEALSMASHQLRTPLTSVIGLAQHIKRRTEQGRFESVAELVDPLVQEAFRIDAILGQWNQLALAESFRRAFATDPIELVDVVAGLVARFRARHPEMHITEVYPDHVPTIRSDAERIGEIVDNLLENAQKYGGDRLEVRIERVPNGLAIQCRDHGPGIPQEIAPFIFERFYRGSTGGDHAGMGLGLYISRKLAEGLGGTLDVASTPGEGAQFTLFVPWAAPPRTDVLPGGA